VEEMISIVTKKYKIKMELDGMVVTSTTDGTDSLIFETYSEVKGFIDDLEVVASYAREWKERTKSK
jgi:hypothetical protein